MKKLPISILPMLLLATLSCCTSSPTMVANPKTGETASCAVTAMTRSIAEQAASVCQQNYQAAGWVSVSGQIADSSHVGL